MTCTVQYVSNMATYLHAFCKSFLLAFSMFFSVLHLRYFALVRVDLKVSIYAIFYYYFVNMTV